MSREMFAPKSMTDEQKAANLASIDSNIDYWHKLDDKMMVEAFQRTREIYHGERKVIENDEQTG